MRNPPLAVQSRTKLWFAMCATLVAAALAGFALVWVMLTVPPMAGSTAAAHPAQAQAATGIVFILFESLFLLLSPALHRAAVWDDGVRLAGMPISIWISRGFRSKLRWSEIEDLQVEDKDGKRRLSRVQLSGGRSWSCWTHIFEDSYDEGVDDKILDGWNRAKLGKGGGPFPEAKGGGPRSP
jgi:hypothetical protein